MARLRPLLLATALLGCAARGSTPDGGVAPPAPFRWQIPQAIEAVDVPGRTMAMGMPVAIHAVRSKAKPDVLEHELTRQFLAAGLYFTPSRQMLPSSGMDQLTGLDPATYIAYTAFLQPNPDGTTTVLLTETFLAEQQHRAAQAEFAPVMPGASDLMVSRTEGLQTAHYRVQATPAQVDTFYRESLTRSGYRQTGEREFERGSEQLRITVTAASARGSQNVLLVHVQGGGLATPAAARERVAPQPPRGSQ